MKKSFLAILLFFWIFSLFSQTLVVPKDYKLEKAEDFDFYQPKVIECIKWIVETPLQQSSDIRQEVNSFLMKWFSGTQKITLNVNKIIQPLVDELDYKYSEDLLMIYLGTMAKYMLENPNDKDKFKIYQKGMNSMMECYTKSHPEEKSRAMNYYFKLKDKNKLDKYISSNM